MKFTIVFQSISHNFAYMFAFEPCPVWKKYSDSEPFLVPNPSFARNTLDCLNFVRRLKELGIGVIFENINTDTA